MSSACDTVILCQICVSEQIDIDICHHCDRAVCDNCKQKYDIFYIPCSECDILTCYRGSKFGLDERCERASSYKCFCKD